MTTHRAAVTRTDDNYVDLVTADGYRLRFRYDALPEENRRNRGALIPALLKQQDRKDKTTMKDVGQIVRAVALSTTYNYRASG